MSAASRAGARLVAYVGSYTRPDDPTDGGGITVLDVSADGSHLTPLSAVAEPVEAGYLVYAPGTRTLYAVDERKTDGRGPVGRAAAVHALTASAADGSLTWLNSRPAPGAFPCYLTLDETRRALISANHGGFDHVERVVRTPDGGWDVEYAYDDSAVLLYDLEGAGRIGALRDVQVLTGHGQDPNSSLQAGGHAQSGGHAHSAVFDPSGEYLLVADKGTDHLLVHRVGDALEPVGHHRFPPETGPRHIAFDPTTGLGFVTCEFASDLASFRFDPRTGEIEVLDRVSTLPADHTGSNEPADVRVHPHGGVVYVNNRGEDTVAWFSVGTDGRLTRRGAVPLAGSLHPGVAARSFAFDPTGSFLLVADRPADRVRSYAVKESDGALTPLTDVHVTQPAFVTFAQLDQEPT